MKSYRITGIIDDPHNNTINLLFRLGTAINIFEGFYFLYLLFVQKMDGCCCMYRGAAARVG